MSFTPLMWSTFCDDVRQEVGNKLSFLGVYGPTLIVESFPATLVKLCSVMSLRMPADPPPRNVVFRILRGDELLFEADLSPTESRPLPPAHVMDAMDVAVLTLSTAAQLISFPITQRCLLRTIAVVDGLELRGGTLELLAANADR